MAGDSPSQYAGTSMTASFVTTELMGVAISLPIIATIATVMRIYAASLKGQKWLRSGDIWFLFLTLVLSWAHSINTIIAGAIGGIDTITVSPHDYPNIALRTLWISSFFLITALYTIKISLLIFYYHLFSVQPWFHRAVIGMSVILTLWWLSSIILALCSTVPFDAAFHNATLARHRFDFNTWYLSYSALSIFFDVVILCFPIPMIRRLQNVSTIRKFSILAIFWLGGFVVVSATVRFVLLYRSIYKLESFGENRYRAYTEAFIWAEVEPNTSIVAACLPALGPLVREVGWIRSAVRSVKSTLFLSSRYGAGSEKSKEVSKTASAGSGKKGFVEIREGDVEMAQRDKKSGEDSDARWGGRGVVSMDEGVGRGRI
ncbi:hypothetical protein M011DRAFT_328307 [Sporormia fimetaria CBS 119925]|uniref:Rhodopsin domain-containing protein n=1 Tax=Sporormia fimetaria CBS 119925 TaxID=1340428 RepID=A0A6A6VHA9_9PLEO|nr:hypothetical protein M011DRAFT_328307 [Sporormia fimetaria CBS 119925]